MNKLYSFLFGRQLVVAFRASTCVQHSEFGIIVIAGCLAPALNPNMIITIQTWISSESKTKLKNMSFQNSISSACWTKKKVYLQSGPRLVKEKISWQWQCTGNNINGQMLGVNLIICQRTTEYVRMKPKSDFYFPKLESF